MFVQTQTYNNKKTSNINTKSTSFKDRAKTQIQDIIPQEVPEKVTRAIVATDRTHHHQRAVFESIMQKIIILSQEKSRDITVSLRHIQWVAIGVGMEKAQTR